MSVGAVGMAPRGPAAKKSGQEEGTASDHRYIFTVCVESVGVAKGSRFGA